jgi:citrate lyase subunit beta / citryl-CoA lyase
MTDIGSIRTALFAPGNHPERIDKAIKSTADAIILDLEDAVPLPEKAQTRLIVAQKIEQHAARYIIVRVNSLETSLLNADIPEILLPGLNAIMVPKIQKPEDIQNIHLLLTEKEKIKGKEPNSVGLIYLIESALGVENTFRIASATKSIARQQRIAFGGADYTLDMRIQMSKSGEELSYPRARITVGCRAAGIHVPLDTPFMINMKNIEDLTADSMQSRNLGFGGRLCIHPIQVDVCNRIYTPDEKMVAFALKAIKAYDAASALGEGVIQVDGRMVDYPIMVECRRILSIAADNHNLPLNENPKQPGESE